MYFYTGAAQVIELSMYCLGCSIDAKLNDKQVLDNTEAKGVLFCGKPS